MSQEGENYITPIFPLNSEKLINNETEEEEELFNQEGGSIRTITDFLDKHRDKILNVFEKGYSSNLKLYLPSIDKIIVYPDPTGNPYVVKKFEDLENDRWFPKDVQTTPVYFLYQFLYKTDLMDKARDDPVIQKTLPYDQDKHQLLLEISIRLYILCYLLIFSQNSLCIDNVDNTSLFKRYIVKKEKDDLETFLINLKDRLNYVTDTDSTIQRCMFGLDIDNDDDFEIICNIMYQYALVTFMGRKNYEAQVITKFQESYFFDSMRSFLDTMIGKAKEKGAAIKTSTPTSPPVSPGALKNELKIMLEDLHKKKTLKRTEVTLVNVFMLEKALMAKFPTVTTSEVLAALEELNKDPKELEGIVRKTPKFAFLAPTDDCEWFKTIVNESGKVADREHITPAEEAIITGIRSTLDHAAMEKCITELNKYFPNPTPPYGFAAATTPPPPPPSSAVDCSLLKAAMDVAGIIQDKGKITDAEVATLTQQDPLWTKVEIEKCLQDPIFGGLYKLEPTVAAQTQCDVVIKFVQNRVNKTFVERDIQQFLTTDAEAQREKITLDIFKQCIDAINAQIGTDEFKVVASFQGPTLSGADYKIKDVPGDGWCFYHALLQSVGDKQSNYPMLTPDEVEKDTSDPITEVKPFIGEIRTFIDDPNRQAEKTQWGNLYNQVYGQGKYTTYITNLDDENTKPWADPEYGIGDAATHILGAEIEIYQQFGNDYGLIQTYKEPNIIHSPPRKIQLHYINKNHYQILLKKPAGAPPPPPPPAQNPKQKYPKLPGPDPTDQDCLDLLAYFKAKPANYQTSVIPKLNVSNATMLHEEMPKYNIFFLAKCYEKRPDLFPPTDFGFDGQLEMYLHVPRPSGPPTDAECQLVKQRIDNATQTDPNRRKQLTEVDLSIPEAFDYWHSKPFVAKCIADKPNIFPPTEYGIDPSVQIGKYDDFMYGGVNKRRNRKTSRRNKKKTQKKGRKTTRKNRRV